MTNGGSSLVIKKPVSVWNNPLKANFRDLFKSLGKGVIDGVTGNWTGVAGDVLEAGVAVGLENEPGQVAWLLIYRSLNKALANLITDNRVLLVKQPRNLDDICDRLEQSLASLELTIDTEFFRVPREFALLSQIIPPFEQWLREFVEPEHPAQAQTIAERLPTYFVYALNDEWRKRAKDYECLKQIDTPFTKATEREQAWREYASWLQQQVEEPLLGVAAFGLRKVYVPLRVYYEQESDDVEELGPKRRDQKTKRIVVDLHSELEAWLQQADKDDAVRVVSGGPGSGKSSFTKIFAANLAQQPQVRVLYVPLHRIDPAKDLVAALSEFTSDDKFLRFNPLDPNHREDRLLLIFDGLDELSMQGKVGAEVAQRFVQEVQRQVDRLNYYDLHVQALLSGRELVVQANASEFRKEKQVLHLLPYFIIKEDKEDYPDSNDQLNKDQRQIWWKKYGQASGTLYSQLPGILDRGKLQDLTAQPLLNYLVALSYEQGDVEFSHSTNLNVIYQDLLRQVYRRCWERYPHPSLKGVKESSFVRVLEEIALAAWHGDGRTTTVSAIESQFEKANLSSLLVAFQEGAKQGVTRLLTAFYFRQSGQQRPGESTFEFTHKSFGEYLTARRIVRAVQRIHDQLLRQQDDPDEGWDKRSALAHWAEICGPTRMDQYLFEFVYDEIQLKYQEDEALVAAWQCTLSELIGFMLKHGMPMEKLTPRPDFHEENRQAINAEEVLLAAVNACARCTHTISSISWPSPESFGSWLARLQGQRTTSKNVLALQCLGWLDLANSVLVGRDLSGASLDRAILDGAILDGAILDGAILDRARLDRARLGGGSLIGASLIGTRLDGAILDGAILDRAILDGAILDGAILDGARFDRARLDRAILDRASLIGVRLDRASLIGARLDRAILDGAILDAAVLGGASFVGTSLVGASLVGARLDGASLVEAKLDRAILDGASLIGTRLVACSGLMLEQVQKARGWEGVTYDPEFRELLGLPPEGNTQKGNES